MALCNASPSKEPGLVTTRGTVRPRHVLRLVKKNPQKPKMAVRGSWRRLRGAGQRRGPLITRSANPVPRLLPRLYPCGVRSLPSGGGCRRAGLSLSRGLGTSVQSSRCSDRTAAPWARQGSSARGCPPAQGRARCRRCPRGGGGTSAGETRETERPGGRRVPAPGCLCRGLGRSSGSGTAPSPGPRLGQQSSQTWDRVKAAPLRSETSASSARAGAPLRRGTGGLRPGGSAAHSRCHNLLPWPLGVPFDSVVGAASRGRTGSCRRRRQPSTPDWWMGAEREGSATPELRGGRSGRSRAGAPATASCPGEERRESRGRRMLGGGSCPAAPPAANDGGRRGEQVRLLPGPPPSPRPEPGTAQWLTRPGWSRGQGWPRTRGSEPARPWGCPPARGTTCGPRNPQPGRAPVPSDELRVGWPQLQFPPREQSPTGGALGGRTPYRNGSLMFSS